MAKWTLQQKDTLRESDQDIDIWCKVKWKPVRKGTTWNSTYVCNGIPSSQSHCTEGYISWWLFVWCTKFKGCNDNSWPDWIGIEQTGILIKKIRFSRKDPPATLSNDEVSINIAGMRYQRGFAITRHQWITFCQEIQQKEVIITTDYHSSKHCKKALCFKMIFDLTGKITSITATTWLDLYTMVKKVLNGKTCYLMN